MANIAWINTFENKVELLDVKAGEHVVFSCQAKKHTFMEALTNDRYILLTNNKFAILKS